MENGVVDFLRDRAEENLDDVLKSSMGGYTKKSVQDYVIQLRKRQQMASKLFNESMKSVLAEKEELKEELERMKARLGQREAQYLTLTESFQEYKQADESANVENIMEMKRLLAQQEDEISALKTEKQLLEQKQAQSEHYIEEMKSEMDQNMQEHRLTMDLLHEEKKKGMNALKQVQELFSQLTITQEELDFLKEQTSEGAISKLKENVSGLQNELKTQQEILEQRREELQEKDRQIQAYIGQNDMKEKQMKMLEEKAEKLQRTIELVTVQNQSMEAYQQELTAKLQEVFQDNLKILHAKSELHLENLRLLKKLDDMSHMLTQEKEEQEGIEA